MPRRVNKEVDPQLDPNVEPETFKSPSPVIETISDIAHLMEDIVSQLMDKLSESDHPDPKEASKEMLTAGYNVALISIEAGASSRSIVPRRVGFNR